MYVLSFEVLSVPCVQVANVLVGGKHKNLVRILMLMESPLCSGTFNGVQWKGHVV